MSSKICRRCGAITNTAVCDWMNSPDDKADKCYAKYNLANESWEKGCAYDEADFYEKHFVDKITNEEE